MHNTSKASSIKSTDSTPDKTTPPPEFDVEKNNVPPTLTHEPSEPPYSAFSKGMKIWIIFLVSASALISPFGATTFLPALNVLSDVLHITPTQVNIAVTTYMIAQAIAPAFIGTMSDNNGRRLSFIVCYVIFILGNIGLALQTNYAALLVLRMVQAVGGTATIALTFAVVADLATSAERGKYMGYAGAGILMGPAFGPSIGGLLAQFLGWRSIFWFLAIFSGILLVLTVFFFPETCRKVVGNGSIPPKGIHHTIFSYMDQRRRTKQTNGTSTTDVELPRKKIAYPNPTAVFRIIAEKETCIILLYNGFFFTGMMVTITAIPTLYSRAYGLNELHIGLCYIANGMGSLTASLTIGHIVDWNFRRYAKALGIPIIKGKQQDLSKMPIERIRMQIVVPGHFISLVGLLIFGWTVKFRTHLAGPEIALFITGFGFSGVFNITNGLLIDLHRDQPAAATAATNFTRCLMSAGGSAAIIPLCDALNPGWAFTMLTGIYVLLIGVVWLIIRDGMKWRLALEEKKRKRREVKENEKAGT